MHKTANRYSFIAIALFARQKQLGVISQDCQLTPRHKVIPAWDEMPDDLKPVLRRQMEVYAGFLEYTDHHIGRMLESLEKLGQLENTLIYYIIGDNGAAAMIFSADDGCDAGEGIRERPSHRTTVREEMGSQGM